MKRRPSGRVKLAKAADEAPRGTETSIWFSPGTSHMHAPGPQPSLSSTTTLLRDRSALSSSAKQFLESVIGEFVVVISASVRVGYHGRASSTASLSPRIVLTKPDGTLIIHEDTKHRPLNWQPPGTRFCLSIGDDSALVLEAFRKKDKETVVVWFDELYFIAASRITPGEFRFSGSESQMVDLIARNPRIIEAGFVPEKRELRTSHGTVDLVGRDKDGNILVLEFKRRQAQLDSASQLARYVRYFTEREERLDKRRKRPEGGEKRKEKTTTTMMMIRRRRKKKVKVRGGVVAPTITGDALLLLRKMGYEFFKLEPRIETLIGVPLIAGSDSPR